MTEPEPASTNAPAAANANMQDPTESPDEKLHLHMPVDIRSMALVVLAALACLFTLHWAAAVFVPLVVGLMVSYALSPVVDWLGKYRVPRALSAAVLILGILGSAGGTVYGLSDDASKLLESLPLAGQKLRETLRPTLGKPDSTLASVQKAAAQLEQAAEETAKPAPANRGVQRVQIEKPRFDVKDYLWSGTLGLLALLGQIVTVALISFFLMASGDTFRRKLVKLAGPTLAAKKVTLQALNEITSQIQRYLLVQLFTSALVGVATWLCFLLIGLEHAAVWGVAAGVLNLVPYLGSVVITAGSALVGFMQFGTLQMALMVALISLVINSIEGFLLTPWLTSRASRMNPVAIFVGVLAWGWLWGPAGLLIGVPILMVIKSVCDRVEDLKPVGELLGE